MFLLGEDNTRVVGMTRTTTGLMNTCDLVNPETNLVDSTRHTALSNGFNQKLVAPVLIGPQDLLVYGYLLYSNFREYTRAFG